MRKILVVFVLFQLIACDYFQPREKPDALARVGESFLTQEDFANLGLDDVSPEDSANIVSSYIDTWIRKESFIQHATQNLTPSQLADISQKVDDYKQSLLMHLYEETIAAKHVDTLVSEEESTAYYNTHVEDFAVREPVLRYVLFKRDQPFTNKNEIENWLADYWKNNNDAELRSFCSYQTLLCHLDATTWVTESTFLETFAGEESTQSKPNLQVGRLFAVQRGNYYYLYQIIERTTDGIYPIDFVRSEIEKTIIRNREQEFLADLREQIYNEAKNRNEIEIFE